MSWLDDEKEREATAEFVLKHAKMLQQVIRDFERLPRSVKKQHDSLAVPERAESGFQTLTRYKNAGFAASSTEL